MKANPKHHHYVPEFELDYFANNKILWVYDRKLKVIRPQSVKDTAAISHYYSFKTTTGEIDNGMEHALGVAESFAAPIINKIHENESYKFTPQDKLEFATYLALKWTRTPMHQKKSEAIFEAVIKTSSRKLATDENKFKEAMNYVAQKTGKEVGDIKGQKEFMMNPDRYTVETTRLTSLQSMALGLKPSYEAIYNMRWVFRFAPKEKAFITSDNPFVVKPFFETDDPLGCGLYTPHTVTFIALTPRVCLTLTRGGTEIYGGKIPGDMVNEINETLALFSTRFVISHNERLLRRTIERTKLSNIKPYNAVVTVNDGLGSEFTVIKD